MTWLKLGIPILLGVAAAGINWVAMSSGAQPEEFTRVSGPLKAGEPFTESVLEKVELRGDTGPLKETAIPWAMRKVLFNRPALRDLKKGDLALWRDITPPRPELSLGEGESALPVSLEGVSMPPQLIQVGHYVDFVITRPTPRTAAELAKEKPDARPAFEVVGPFRVVSVGDILAPRAGDDTSGAVEARAAQQRTLTIAMKRKGDAIEDRNIVKLLEARVDERNGQKRIIELVLNRPSRGK